MVNKCARSRDGMGAGRTVCDIAMERRGRTDIWLEVNDVSNLTLLDKILRDARRGLAGHALTVAPGPAKCNLKLQESTVRTCADRDHLSSYRTIAIDTFAPAGLTLEKLNYAAVPSWTRWKGGTRQEFFKSSIKARLHLGDGNKLGSFVVTRCVTGEVGVNRSPY